MYLVYFALRFYPFWTIPLALLMLELGRLAARRKSKKRFAFYGIGAFFLTTAAIWIVFGGGNNSDHWLRSLSG